MTTVKSFYTVQDVAREFEVSNQTVRNWIKARKLVAIQPASTNGVYRIPMAAVSAMKRRMGTLPAPAVREAMPAAELPEPGAIYAERIQPVLEQTGATADQIIKRVAEGGPASQADVTFVRDYARYAVRIARVQRLTAPANQPESTVAKHASSNARARA